MRTFRALFYTISEASLTKKIALIAGAGGGMGLATVRRLHADGFRIAALDLHVTELKNMMDSEGIDGSVFQVDGSDEASCQAAVREVIKSFGQIDAMVNLIGWTATSKFLDEKSDYWSKLIGINFMSVVHLTHAVAPGMIERGGGKIVYVTSDAGKVGQSGEAVYAGLKGGVIAFAKSVAREFARYKINVNCTAPGPTDTPLEHDQDPDVVQRIIKKIPFRRWASPEEQAAAISFFVSDDSSYVTGQVLSVSGGLTMS